MPDDLPKKGEPIIFFDVESLPAEKDNPIWQKLAAVLDVVEDESPEDRAGRVEAARLRSALYGPLGRAWMIGFADRMGEPTILSSDGSVEGEKPLLEEFWGCVEGFDNPWWVGHNIIGYDIPFLQARSLHHGLPLLARKLGRARIKPWEQRVLDTRSLFPQTGAERMSWKEGLRGLGKLDTICALLGIEQQEGVDGAGVYDAYLSGNQKGVEEHLYSDVCQVREVFRRIWPIL